MRGKWSVWLKKLSDLSVALATIGQRGGGFAMTHGRGHGAKHDSGLDPREPPKGDAEGEIYSIR